MKVSNRLEPLVLLFGDIIFFSFSLLAALFVRHFEFPSAPSLYNHFSAFSLLFGVWVIVFFTAGLYDKHTTFFKNKLPDLILRAQLVNVLIAGVFFFFISYFAIAPKTVLVLYLFISVGLITVWRLYIFDFLNRGKRQKAFLLEETEEMEELVSEVNANKRYHLHFVSNERRGSGAIFVGDPYQQYGGELERVVKKAREDGRFFDVYEVYERVFDRIPYSIIEKPWFAEKVSPLATYIYDFAKRVIDILGALLLSAIIVVTLPIIAFSIKIESAGPVFIWQKRMGRNGNIIRALKFRTMERVEEGVWIGETENKVTRVGAILRKASIDELPQCVNILKGEMSLIGPRNDVYSLGERLADAIPAYEMRYAVKPGITGWAQTRQQYRPGNISPQSIEETKVRLTYDLYYIKNRSLLLDIEIAFRTITTILTRFGI